MKKTESTVKTISNKDDLRWIEFKNKWKEMEGKVIHVKIGKTVGHEAEMKIELLFLEGPDSGRTREINVINAYYDF